MVNFVGLALDFARVVFNSAMRVLNSTTFVLDSATLAVVIDFVAVVLALVVVIDFVVVLVVALVVVINFAILLVVALVVVIGFAVVLVVTLVVVIGFAVLVIGFVGVDFSVVKIRFVDRVKLGVFGVAKGLNPVPDGGKVRMVGSITSFFVSPVIHHGKFKNEKATQIVAKDVRKIKENRAIVLERASENE